MVLKLKVRICYKDKCVESIGVASTGFIGGEPEIILPEHIVREFSGEKLLFTLSERVLADGSRVAMMRSLEPLDLYIVAEDKIRGPVKVYAYTSRGGLVFLNESVISAMRIVIIDPLEGLWCFREELGERVRRGG